MPDDLSIPDVCPTCGAGWDGWTRSPNAEDPTVGKQCRNGHSHDFELSLEEMFRVQMANDPYLLEGHRAYMVSGPLDGRTIDVFGHWTEGDRYRCEFTVAGTTAVLEYEYRRVRTDGDLEFVFASMKRPEDYE